MFKKSAIFYDALYHFKDYEGASTQLHTLIQCFNPGARTLLDVACGTGRHLSYLQSYYQVAGLDISPELLEIAKGRCPEIPFYQGNMVDFHLDHKYDVITCLFSSVGYVKTLQNLKRAVASMASHLQMGGILFIEPWFSPETYWVGKVTANFVDEPELKIAWMYTSEIKENISIFDINFLIGTPQGIHHFTERHEMGLFSHEQYLKAFRQTGMDVIYDEKGLFGRGIYIGEKRELS